MEQRVLAQQPRQCLQCPASRGDEPPRKDRHTGCAPGDFRLARPRIVYGESRSAGGDFLAASSRRHPAKSGDTKVRLC
ncbi:uncharacterized protein STAUR_6682 [Stigmatella aurantiaca DW4/3-1]|uniref:Uncharacterized protein n=1 Tax=Stigmatella aurantiaca (strain DW4/3-1) TaxID=378806 RepID=E3FPS1_STIAD|nr:uncharacterized protein STAUR_6682 [Stigmatella aurantiaca DW4/3-1]